MQISEFEKFIPWVVGVAGTIIALKKDWISARLNMKKGKTEVQSMEEEVEAKALDNLEKTMNIYQKMLKDLEDRHNATLQEIEYQFNLTKGRLEERVDELEQKVKEVNELNREQKELIQRQQRSLRYYKDKYGDVSA